jgi:HlyD family secretion protein
MKRFLGPVLALLVIAAIGVFAWRAWGPRDSDARMLSGYVEADPLYLSSPAAGTVAQVFAVKGRRIERGQPLFAMDPATLQAVQGQAQARLTQAETEIAAVAARAEQARASISAARANETQAARELARHEALRRANPAAYVPAQLDQARAALANARAQRQAAERAAAAQAAEVPAARARAEQARAALSEQRTRLGQLAQTAPASGLVEDVFFQSGEWAAPNQPIVSLIPDGQVKLRFFVPQAEVARYRPGQTVAFGCDGCPANLRAQISYVSPRTEYTPPVIYSRGSRDRLMFMVEAHPPGSVRLQPGLPVDVTPLGPRP